MKTVQEVLNQIRWDERYAKDKFQIAYYDRLKNGFITVPFNEIQFPEDDHFSFYIIDELGETHSIPYHRVKQIYQNDKLIWQRTH